MRRVAPPRSCLAPVRRWHLGGGAVCLLTITIGGTAAVAEPADDPGSPAIYGIDDDQELETVPARPHESGTRAPTGTEVHAVQRGDTLWDIAATHFHDPWRWPKLWALNPEIANPHWIFPGQTIRLRDAGPAAAPTPTPVAATPDEPAAPAGVSVAPTMRRAPPAAQRGELREVGFVDEGTFKEAGVINGSIDEKILLASGDQAYVEFPAGRLPKAGARYSVYQVDTDHPVREPHSSLVLGYLVHVYGEVVIDALTDRPIVNGRLMNLAGPVERGYRVGPLVRQLKSVDAKPNGANVTAHVVASVEPNILIANHMFVVLDRGRRHGVDVGNRFWVQRQGDGLKRVMEDADAMDHRFPPHAVAEIIAVDVQNETTVGWVSSGTRELRVGDVADMRRGD